MLFIVSLLFICINVYKVGSKYFETFLSYISLIILNLLGFKVNIDTLKNVPKKSVIVMSHTSIYDFIFCSMVYHAFFKNKINIYFMIKEEFGKPAKEVCDRFFPYTKVIPINNEASSSQNVVKQVVEELQNKENYALCIAPEGTRKSVSRIRSGFYYISRELKVPVVYCGIDFARKIIQFEVGRKMSESVNEEKTWFIEMCRKYTPLYPENCYYTNDYYTSLKSSEDDSTYQFVEVNPLFKNKVNQSNNDNLSLSESSDSSISNSSNIMNILDNKIKKGDKSSKSYFEMNNPMLEEKSDSDSYVSQISTYDE